jgi:hypothetical protein
MFIHEPKARSAVPGVRPRARVWENTAKFKVVLHFVYVMDGFRRYTHAWVQSLAKYKIVFHFEKTYFAVYSNFFVLNFEKKFKKVQYVLFFDFNRK